MLWIFIQGYLVCLFYAFVMVIVIGDGVLKRDQKGD